MKFDFTKLKLSEEVTKALGTPEVIAAMDTASDAQIGVEVSSQVAAKETEFTTAKDGFKTSMDALDVKLKAAEKSLKDHLGKKSGNANDDDVKAAQLRVTELESQLSTLTEEHNTLTTTHTEISNDLQTLQHHGTIVNAIAKYNKGNKEFQANPDSVEIIEMYAQKYVKPKADGTYEINRFDGKPLTTAEGLATTTDWVKYLQKEKPSLFSKPAGSGAPGSGTGGASDKFITRGEFEKLTPDAKAKTALTHQLVD